MLDKLMDRFMPEYLAQRLRLQVDYITRLFGDGVSRFHVENIDALYPVLQLGLRASGLWQRGIRNGLDYRVTHNALDVSGLPSPFAGLRILHLSDLHIDVDAQHSVRVVEHLQAALRPLTFDVCVITGDLRYHSSGSYDRVHTLIEQIMPALQCPHGVYGILGNHDFVEQVPYLEAMGVRMLVNEAVALERDGAQLWLVGLDDPHFYGTHSFGMALAEVSDASCKIMLIHSPELAEEAERQGAALYLTGHTHGGQLCLPGGFAPYVNARCPRPRTIGRWQCGRMVGYTSAGTGSSGLPVRYNRPPEIAIHELRPA